MATAPDGKPWDYSLGVTMDTAGGGARSLQLCFNRGDDANTVAANFCAAHGVGMDSFEQVRDFILSAKAKRGDTDVGGGGGGGGAVLAPRARTHFPSGAFLTLDAVDWRKVQPKLEEFNAALAAAGAPAALSDAELGGIKALIAVLAQTSRWHATSVPLPAVRALFAKCLQQWPVAQLFPALDTLRVLLCHPEGAAAVAEAAGGGFVAGATARIAALRSRPPGDKEARAAVLLTARCLFNAWHQPPTRALLHAALPAVMDATSDLLQHEAPAVRFAGAVLLHNTAHALGAQALAAWQAAATAATRPSTASSFSAAALPASASAAAAAAPPESAHVEQLLGLVVEGLQALRPPPPVPAGAGAPTDAAAPAADAAGGDDAVLKLLVALGTVVLAVGPSAAQTARALELEDALAQLPGALFPHSAPIREAVAELLPLIRAP